MFAELLWVEPEQVVAGGNSSLTMMRDTLIYLLLFGARGQRPRRGARRSTVKFICPVPGYDRHFTLLESLGIEMITVPMNDDGPDVDAVAALVEGGPARSRACGSCRPTPTRPARSAARRSRPGSPSMETAAHDFKIFWDNAYALHHLTEEEAKSADILTLASAAGHPHRPIMFASTSKITFAGAGVAFLAASDGQHRVVPRAPRQRLDRPRQGQPPAPRAVLRLAAGRARPHGQAPRRSSRPSSPRSTGCSPSASTATRSRRGTSPPAATSSTSTSCPGRPAAWSRWPRRSASR